LSHPASDSAGKLVSPSSIILLRIEVIIVPRIRSGLSRAKRHTPNRKCGRRSEYRIAARGPRRLRRPLRPRADFPAALPRIQRKSGRGSATRGPRCARRRRYEPRRDPRVPLQRGDLLALTERPELKHNGGCRLEGASWLADRGRGGRSFGGTLPLATRAG
jgi:hypothetical protein